MLNIQDSVFWAYFNELVKKIPNPIYKKNTVELKTKINEIFNVTYYSLFQFQLAKGESFLSIQQETIEELTKYIIDNYKVLFTFTYQNKNAISKFENIDESKEFIVQTIEQIVLPFVSANCFYKPNNFFYCNNAKQTLLMTLIMKNEFDINYIKKGTNSAIFHGLSYPFLVTMLIVDVLEPSKMFDRIKNFYTPENIDKALRYGRELSEHEKEYLNPELDRINDEEDFFSFITNFKQETWNLFDINTRYKYLFHLSKYTVIFLKDNIKSLNAFGNEEEVLDLVYNYLPMFISSHEEGFTIEFNSLDVNKNNGASFLLPFVNKDQIVPKIVKHIETIKEYKKLPFEEENLTEFIINIKYSTAYLEIIYKLKRGNGIIGNFIIQDKKTAVVDTLKFYEEKSKGQYEFKYNNVKYNAIKLDIKNLEHLTTPANRFEEIADKNSEMSVLLRIISLMLAMEPKTARKFGYSWQSLIKYYIIAFGPYKKQSAVFDKKTFKIVEAKISKLIEQYEFLKQKDLVIDSMYLIYKLANFKN